MFDLNILFDKNCFYQHRKWVRQRITLARANCHAMVGCGWLFSETVLVVASPIWLFAQNFGLSLELESYSY